MIQSKQRIACIAGALLSAQAVMAGPVMAAPRDDGYFDAASFGWSAPVDSAVLGGTTAWIGNDPLLPEWSRRQAAFAAFLRPSSGRDIEGASRSRAEEAGLLPSADTADFPAGLAAIAASAELRRSQDGEGPMRLVVQWQESTTLREAGGISHATTNVFIEVGVDGFAGLGAFAR